MGRQIALWKRAAGPVAAGAALLACMIGCAPRETRPATAGPPTSGQAAAPAQEITHVAYRDSLADIAVSPEGLYRVQQVRPASVNLFYIDAKTRREMYLCAAPNCSHDTEACTSYLPLEEGEYGCQLFFCNGSLYIVQCAATQEHAPYLMRLNQDGSGREKVVELKSGESFIGALFGYGDSILIEINAVAENGTGGPRLEKIDLKTGRRKTIVEYSLGNRSYAGAMGAAGDQLVYLSMDTSGKQYFKVDPSVAGQSLEECRRQAPLTEVFDGEQVVYILQNDYLCGLDRMAQKLFYQNLATGEKREFDVPALEQGDKLYGLELLYDSEFALTLDDADGKLIRAMWDGRTGELTGVRYAQTRQNNNTPVAAFGDMLIYMSREAQAPLKDQADLGLSGEMYYYTVYGAISKADFLKGEKGQEIRFPVD